MGEIKIGSRSSLSTWCVYLFMTRVDVVDGLQDNLGETVDVLVVGLYFSTYCLLDH